MEKLVTLSQLEYAINQLRRLIDQKASLSSPTFPSVTLDGGLTLSVGEDPISGKQALLITNQNNGFSYIPIADGDQQMAAIMQGNGDDIDANSITVDAIKDPGYMSIDDGNRVPWTYALPHSSSETKSIANRPTHGAGGTVLTSRYRSFFRATIDAVRSTDEDIETYNISSGIYYIVSTNRINFNLIETQTTNVDEFWIQVKLDDVENPLITFESTNNTQFMWAGEEPDWSRMGGCTLQIHVLNNIISYVVAPPSEENNN